jgi:hypothetical protein
MWIAQTIGNERLAGLSLAAGEAHTKAINKVALEGDGKRSATPLWLRGHI